MDPRTAKKQASAAGLGLYYDAQWASWGLIDPDCGVEGEWFSAGSLRSMDASQLEILIRLVADRVQARREELSDDA
jgi:hypothetical protein